MHRAVLHACLPWFFWLCVASVAALLLVQYCGVRIDWRRLRRLKQCEEGAVQSLSLVLTLPVFLMLVLFIVQMSQLMVGIMLVHYAAFAGARAASVWIPMDIIEGDTFHDDLNRNPYLYQDEYWQVPVIEPSNVLNGNTIYAQMESAGLGEMNIQNSAGSIKYPRIAQAAVIPLLTISPSRALGGMQLPAGYQATFDAIAKLYPDIDPKSKNNNRIPQRLRNKLTYAANNTQVTVGWQNVDHPIRDVREGPTYNPYNHPNIYVPRWNPQEVGFRDPVTVGVVHRFALLPGIGRILHGNNSSKIDPDRVYQRIGGSSAGNENVYWVELKATATFVNEGNKSTVRYGMQP